MMSLRDLNYLVAVADAQSFVRAAECCCVSQPALSMQVKKVEVTLGVTIFDRTGRRVQCTPIGARLIDKARLVLEQVDDFYAIASEQDRPVDYTPAHNPVRDKTSQTT